ncbi:MAG: hypothetical protein ACRC35_06675 [Angustibacter sp.]
MAVHTTPMPATVVRGANPVRRPVDQMPVPRPVLRATAWSSFLGLATGLVLGAITQAREHDRG